MLKGKILYVIDIYSVIKTQNIKIIGEIAENKISIIMIIELIFIHFIYFYRLWLTAERCNIVFWKRQAEH